MDRPGGDAGAGTGRSSRRAGRARPRSRNAAGRGTRSTRSSWPRLEAEGLAPRTGGRRRRRLIRRVYARPDGPAAVCRRRSTRSWPTARPTPTRSSSIACWPRRSTASGWRWTGSTAPAIADTNGYQNDFARTMWPWRDWVIAAFNAQPAVRPVHDRADRRRPAAGRDPGPADRHRIQPQQPDGHRGRLDRRGMADRERRRPHRDDVDGLPRPDHGLRPLSRPQVRPDLAGRVLPVPRASSTASTRRASTPRRGATCRR